MLPPLTPKLDPSILPQQHPTSSDELPSAPIDEHAEREKRLDAFVKILRARKDRLSNELLPVVESRFKEAYSLLEAYEKNRVPTLRHIWTEPQKMARSRLSRAAIELEKTEQDLRDVVEYAAQAEVELHALRASRESGAALDFSGQQLDEDLIQRVIAFAKARQQVQAALGAGEASRESDPASGAAAISASSSNGQNSGASLHAIPDNNPGTLGFKTASSSESRSSVHSEGTSEAIASSTDNVWLDLLQFCWKYLERINANSSVLGEIKALIESIKNSNNHDDNLSTPVLSVGSACGGNMNVLLRVIENSTASPSSAAISDSNDGNALPCYEAARSPVEAFNATWNSDWHPQKLISGATGSSTEV